ncbi:MAG TPA: FISUMP domain-containing protein [Trebonia sp.]|jgi:uncharacterized protein (TIGR02145 family)|nr:FISUMP domain-containing protein [Trebonia sp.]
MSLTDPPFGMGVTNTASGDAILRIGVTAALAIAVKNNTDADIALNSGSSAFGIRLPSPALFSVAQLQAITVTAVGWTSTFNAASKTINVTCSQAGTWAVGQILTFALGNVTSSGPAGTGNVVLVPSDLGDAAPLSVGAQLAVANPPKPGNLLLTDVLQVTLDSQGSVLRSASADDPLANTLYLTLKNISAGPLATKRSGNPQVFVSFVYGSTSGALAPDAFDPKVGPQLGSAWKITVGISSAQSPWTGTDPRSDSEEQHPQWTLAPSSANTQLLGAAGTDQANVTFSFSGLVSITPAGHTQMFVLCTGFRRDDQTAYDDHLFVLDIVKLDPPPTRGLISFFGPDPVLAVSDPNALVQIPLRWAMFNVASIALLSSSPVVAPVRKTYQIPPKPVDYDNTTVTLPAPGTSEAVFFTLQAFDAGGGYLNSQQFTAYAQVSYLIGRGGHVYPIALFGSTYWMLENYQFHAAGSYDYGDSPANEATFGRLYDTQVLAQAPDGWSVPTVADWNALFALFGDAKQAYTALTGSGRSGFNATLGGRRSIQPSGSGLYEQAYIYGYYWAANGSACAQFSSVSGQVSAGTPVTNPQTALSVRFIRHA